MSQKQLLKVNQVTKNHESHYFKIEYAYHLQSVHLNPVVNFSQSQ